MSDPTTTNVALAVPAHLSDSGAWDTPMNNNFTELDAIFGSVTSKTLSSSNVTLTQTECQVSILRFTGTITANITITFTSTIKSWICENNTTGAFTVTMSGGSGNVVALPPGSCQIYWDGTNVSFINIGRTGELLDYIGSSVPAWISACTVPPALNCNGGSFSAVTYPRLFAILGGTTLPDLRGRFRANLNQTTSRITTAGGGVDGDTNLSVGGVQTTTIAQANLPNISMSGSSLTASVKGSTAYGSDNDLPTLAGTGVQIDLAGGVGGSGSHVGPISIGGSISLGGSGTDLTNIPPVCVVGITMVWAI